MSNKARASEIEVQAGEVGLEGNLAIPENARGIVIFAHGSGGSRFSPRNRSVDVTRLTRDWFHDPDH